MSKPLDSRQLAAFSAVARRQSFTLAARELHLTQSAISHALKSLEEEVGSRLLERNGRRVLLTLAGEQFLRHVEKILGEMDAARVGLEQLSRWGHGRLRVGASTTACQYILPTVLRGFRQSFPQCAIVIEPGDQNRQMELLTGCQVDLAFMLEPADRREFDFVPLFQDELRFLVSPAHPWARAGRVERGGIAAETFVLYSKASTTFQLVSAYFREEGIALTRCIELGSMEAIKELVKIGVGIGVLAPWIARKEIEAGALLDFPLGDRPLRRNWGVGFLRGRRLALGEETFIGLCRTVTENFGGVSGRSPARGLRRLVVRAESRP